MRLSAALLVVCLSSAGAGERIEHTLTDADNNVSVQNFVRTNTAYPTLKTGYWRVFKRTLHGGKQEGCELIVLNNGKLQFAVCPTRGMSVVDLQLNRQKDFWLGWDSPVKEVVHPSLVDLESRGGLGWLEGFNEWMCRCGLEFAGHPGKDVFTTNTGDTGELTLTLHGKIGNIPASKVTFSIDKEAPHRLRIRGTVYERSFYGPKLKLETEISTVPGSETVEIHDTVTNQGADDQEFQLIYHTNYGTPLLEKGATVSAPIKKLQPMNGHAAKFLQSWNQYEGPTRGFVEQVYLAWPLGDDNGNTTVLLKNAAGSRGASITWNTSELPYLTIWKNTAAKADGYVTGLEPATGFPFNRRVERHFGRVPKLKPGQKREFLLSFGIHASAKSVQEVQDKIDAIQQSVKPQLVTEAPELPPEPKAE